ncbi:SpoIID/LytB domain-containing protein [Peribacillus sp. NPDC097284]|uniref:SpoIID/LytB domain-containing protein n=1 Tax=Peribacillus sp. NPDC097284 TaxID=3364401 RepID=UPI0038169F0F
MRSLRYMCMAFFIIFSTFPAYEAVAAEGSIEMKVKLRNYLGNQTSVTVTATGDYLTFDGELFIKSGEELTVKVEAGKLVVYKNTKKLETYSSFTATPVKEDSLLTINNRQYPGSMEFTVEGGYVRPINHVHIEEYVKGVVPKEMPALWHIEALKAQTIAARTYALRFQSKVIDDTVSYQVYGGADGHDRSNLAVKQTTGLVIKHDGKLIEALFSSSNGGMTELNSNVWMSGKPLAYLDIKEDPFDPKIKWSVTLDKQQIDLSKKDLSKPGDWWTSVKEKDTAVVPNLKSWLQSNGYNKKDIKITDIPVLALSDRTSGGRVTKGSIQMNFYVKDMLDEKGKLVQQTVTELNVPASKIRAMVGADKMKSYLVVDSTSTNSERISIDGLGFGHGVGMSQYGAKYRAEFGQTFQEILGFYYPNTTIVREYADAEPEQEPAVNKDTTAPSITAVKATEDYSNNKVGITYSMNEDAIVSLTIKDGMGNVVATPVREQALKKGSQSATWNIKDVSSGTYTAEIIATDRGRNRSTVIWAIKVSKDTTAPKITTIDTSGNYSTEKASISYHINEDAKVTVQIKNSKGQVIATPTNAKSLKKGNHSATWNFQNVSNGSYTALIIASDASDNQRTATTKINIKKTTGKVTATVLNIREKANTTSKIVGKLKKNQTVTILAQQGSWYKVKYGTKSGYVSKTYIKK